MIVINNTIYYSTQLAKYQCILYVKPLNTMYKILLPGSSLLHKFLPKLSMLLFKLCHLTPICEHSFSDKRSYIFKSLGVLKNYCFLFSLEDCFKILDLASTRYQLNWDQGGHAHLLRTALIEYANETAYLFIFVILVCLWSLFTFFLGA